MQNLDVVTTTYQLLPEGKMRTLCSKNDIGDEYHYLLKCEYFDNEKNTYIETRYI